MKENKNFNNKKKKKEKEKEIPAPAFSLQNFWLPCLDKLTENQGN